MKSFAGDVICMDNASYHTRTDTDIPNSKSGKHEYEEYLLTSAFQTPPIIIIVR